MATARRGDTVVLHYTGKLSDGFVFDSTENAGDEQWRNFKGRGVAFEPARLVVGEGQMPPDFEEALLGMAPGERKSFTIPAARAFGPRDPARVVEVPRDEIAPRELGIESFRVAEGRRRPNVFDPKVGDVLDLKDAAGALHRARVLAIDDEKVTLDGNHPLAGRDLVFEVKVVDVIAGRA
jgi:peptidylprolyl isomerase